MTINDREVMRELAKMIVEEMQALKPQKKQAEKPVYSDTVIGLNEHFINEYKRQGLENYIKPSKKWLDQLRLMIDSDKYPPEQIANVISYAAEQARENISGNVAFMVQSPLSLRKKYLSMLAAMERCGLLHISTHVPQPSYDRRFV